MLKICVIGLGYVGLPICLKLANNFKTVGYDVNLKRIKSLKKGIDINDEFKKKEIKKRNLTFSNKLEDIVTCNFYIICVPTPITRSKEPDLKYIYKTFELLSKILKKGDIIVLESTVYPGVTQMFINKLERETKLVNNIDFSTCYSPERINPGDKERNLNDINKILAYEGKNIRVKKLLITIYKKISKNLIFSKSIKEAEAAKGIENIQRDLNIALFNEILIICNRLNLNFNEVVRLASTKWNFLNFSPGLVGGHCLPVDPYYLTYIAKKKGYKSKVTLSGRDVNNYMKKYVINFTDFVIKSSKLKKDKVKICVIGLTYKYGVADTRNSQKIELLKYFKKKFKNTRGFDPFFRATDSLKNHELKKYNFFLFLTNGPKFKTIARLVDKKKIIDPFFYYTN
tara:strand:- start:2528 stop:3724 length:1197 start_codon:yes stop_codon:yes gene_type:complete